MKVTEIQIDPDDDYTYYGPRLRFAGCLPEADMQALQASAAKIETALVEAQQEEDRRSADLAAAQAKTAELEAQLAAVPWGAIGLVVWMLDDGPYDEMAVDEVVRWLDTQPQLDDDEQWHQETKERYRVWLAAQQQHGEVHHG